MNFCENVLKCSPNEFFELFGLPRWAFNALLPAFDSKCSHNAKSSLSSTSLLILTLLWFKYDIPDIFLGFLFHICRRTAGNYRHEGIDLLFGILCPLITMKDSAWRVDHGIEIHGDFVTIVLDGSEQPCSQPNDPFLNTEFYSTKKGHHSCNILVGCSPSGNRILFVSNSYPGSVDDRAAVKKESDDSRNPPFASFLKENEFCLGDEGFTGLWEYGKISVMGNTKFEHSKLASVRIRIENVFSKLKKFRCLREKIRIPVDKKNDTDYILREHRKRWIIGCGFINSDFIVF